MFGADRDRLVKAKLIGFEQPRFGGFAFGLVGDQHNRRRRAAQPARNFMVERGHTRARINHEQGDIGMIDCGLRLHPHPPRQGRRIFIFKPCGVDDAEIHAEEARIAFPPVARHAGLVIDQRQPFTDQPVEQRRFADIGAPDNGDGGERARHGFMRSGVSISARPKYVRYRPAHRASRRPQSATRSNRPSCRSGSSPNRRPD